MIAADRRVAVSAARARFWGLVRVAACLATFAAVALLWAVHRAHAYGERVLENLGEHMMRYAGAQHQTAPQQLGLNGATFYLSTGNVRASVEEVLDTFHAKCNQRNGQLHEQWAELGKQRGVRLGPYSSLLDGVFRSSGEHVGVIACVETGDERLLPDALAARVRRVLATGDLAQLGALRYVYVKSGSSPDTTVFIALWSEGHLNYREMFPKDADAPGSDPVGVPRPAWTQRVISAIPKPGGTSFNVYGSKTLSRSELFEFYKAQLPAAGFKLLSTKQQLLVARSGDRMLTMSFRDDRKTGKSLATLAVQAD